MIDFQQKKNIKKIVFSRLMLIVLILLIIFVGKGVFRVYKSESISRENLANVERRYNELLEREQMLDESIKSLKTDEGIEEEIRQKYSVQKEGEISVMIIDDKNTTSKMIDNEKSGFWKRFIGWFK